MNYVGAKSHTKSVKTVNIYVLKIKQTFKLISIIYILGHVACYFNFYRLLFLIYFKQKCNYHVCKHNICMTTFFCVWFYYLTKTLCALKFTFKTYFMRLDIWTNETINYFSMFDFNYVYMYLYKIVIIFLFHPNLSLNNMMFLKIICI